MFMGGVIRWLVQRRLSAADLEVAGTDSGPGVLFSSGLIAGGAIMGVVLAGLAARHLDDAFNLTKVLGAVGASNLASLVFYVVLLAVPLYVVARRVQRVIG
jgi:hypothetical protein